MKTIDEVREHCRLVGKGWHFERKSEMRTIIMAAACLMAAWAAPLAAIDFGPAFPVPLSSLKIDMKNILNVPVGGTALNLDLRYHSWYEGTTQVEVPREWSEGAKCAALRGYLAVPSVERDDPVVRVLDVEADVRQGVHHALDAVEIPSGTFEERLLESKLGLSGVHFHGHIMH